MPYTIRYFCTCCEGRENFVNCPLCEDERFFEYEYEEDIEDFIRDFYSETMIYTDWQKYDNDEKLRLLNEELAEYFRE